MAGHYAGSYLDRSYGWRAVAILVEIGRASFVGRIPVFTYGLGGIPATSRALGRLGWEA